MPYSNLELLITPAGQARLITIAKITSRSVENLAASYVESKCKEFFQKSVYDDPV